MTEATATILRYEVPVDDQWHKLHLRGPIVHVATRRPEVVEVWATTDGYGEDELELRVFGTGQPWPADPPGSVCHMGTAIVPGGDLVWHLMARPLIEPGVPIPQPTGFITTR